MRYLSLMLLVFLAACNMTQSPSTEIVLPTESQNPTSDVLVTPEPEGFVSYWMGTEQALNDESVLIGCQTYLSPIESTTPLGSPEENIRNRLNLTFATAPAAGQRNVWGEDLNFVADSVVIDNGNATIQLSGDIMLRGTCADAEMEAQVLLAIFAEETVQSALIMVGDMNLRQYFDMSGEASSDFTYTRDNIPYATP